MNVDIYLFMLNLNWFDLDLFLLVLNSFIHAIRFLRNGEKILMLSYNVVSTFVKKVLQHLFHILIFSACQTSLWSYRDWLGWIWSGHQNIFQWSQWKTGKIFFFGLLCSLCYNNWLMFLLKMTSRLTGLTEYSPGSPCVNRWKTNMAWNTVCILFF